VGLVTSIGEKRNAYRFLVGSLKARDNVLELVVDGRIILK
jgi:hypothetical protein